MKKRRGWPTKIVSQGRWQVPEYQTRLNVGNLSWRPQDTFLFIFIFTVGLILVSYCLLFARRIDEWKGKGNVLAVPRATAKHKNHGLAGTFPPSLSSFSIQPPNPKSKLVNFWAAGVIEKVKKVKTHVAASQTVPLKKRKAATWLMSSPEGACHGSTARKGRD